MTTRQVIILTGLVLALGNATGDLVCSNGFTTGNTCPCPNDGYYDYRDQMCKDAATMYATDFCGMNAYREADTCKCYDNFAADPDCKTFTPQCTETSCTVANTKRCIESFSEQHGAGYCTCDQGFYHNLEDTCAAMGVSNNPQWHDCPQRAFDYLPGYDCFCYDYTGFENVQDGRSCTLKQGYSNCSDYAANPHVDCYESPDAEQSYFAHPGYKLDESNKAVDINECLEVPDLYCTLNSHCWNLDGEGYKCVCNEGYTSSIFGDDPYIECIPCANSQKFCDTKDPCELVETSTTEVCQQYNDEYEVTQSLHVSVTKQPLSVAFLRGTMTVLNPQHRHTDATTGYSSPGLFATAITRVLGVGTVQATTEDGVTMDVMIQVSNTKRLSNMDLDGIKQLLNAACIAAELQPDYCFLPDSFLINRADINSLLYNDDNCKDCDCPVEDTHHWVKGGNGRSCCLCNTNEAADCSNYEGGVETCTYAEDLANANESLEETKLTLNSTTIQLETTAQELQDTQADLEAEKKDKQSVTIGLSVTLTLVTIAALVLGFFVWKFKNQ